MKTYGDLFTGFGGATIGALAAGLRPLWGVEYRADVAAVANANLGGHVRVADVLACNPADFPRVDVLHASTPCPNVSVAKAGAAETPHDKALASKVAEFVTVLRPTVFTLENVMAYKDSQSWRTIEGALFDCGYWVHQDVCNSADFGVPQTRKRLIVRAVLGGFVPYLPAPVSWVGWYAAVADLLPDLPDSQLAPWQLARLPDHLAQAIAFGSNGNTESWGDHHAAADEPMLAVTAQTLGHSRAVLVQNGKDAAGSVDVAPRLVDADDPAMTISTQASGGTRAVLVDTSNAGRAATEINQDDPAMTLQAWHGRRPSHAPQAVLIKGGDFSGEDGIVMVAQEAPAFGVRAGRSEVHRAVLVGDQFDAPSGNPDRAAQRRDDDAPSLTVTSSNRGDWRAVLVESRNSNQEYGDGLRQQAEPATTVVVVDRPSHAPKAIVSSRVVSMSPRCFARFQSFPDWYVLPEKRTLAALGIGNAAPPLMMQRIFEGLMEVGK